MNCSNVQEDHEDRCVNCDQPISQQKVDHISHMDYEETIKNQMTNTTKSNVGSILTSIYKLEHVAEFNSSADLVCCVRCADILTNLYRFYCEFEKFRETTSQLSNAILKSDSHLLLPQLEADKINLCPVDIQPHDQGPKDDGDTTVKLICSTLLDKKSSIDSSSGQPLWPNVSLTRLTAKVVDSTTTRTTSANKLTTNDDPSSSMSSQNNNDNNNVEKIRKSFRQAIVSTASHPENVKMELDQDDEDVSDDDDDDDLNYDQHYDADEHDDHDYKFDSMDAEVSDLSSDELSIPSEDGPLTTHKKVATNEPNRISYPCNLCSRSFMSQSGHDYHVRVKHRQTPGKPCSICGQYFDTLAERWEHKKIRHKKEKIFECTNCGKKYKHSFRLEKHVKLDQCQKIKFSCPSKCRNVFKSQSDVDDHLAEGNGVCPELKNMITCGICSETIPYLILTSHMKKAHPGQKFQCTQCPKSFRLRQHLRTHLLSHYDVKQHTCHVCGTSFRHKGSLASHVKAHEGIKPYLCSDCGQSFSRADTLRRHMLIHTNEKPHQCPTCHKFFRHLVGLKAHQETVHEPDRFYICAKCGMTFNSKNNFRRHASVHSDSRPSKCQVPGCDRAFKNNKDLKQHGAVHREDRQGKRKGRGIAKKKVGDMDPQLL